MFIRHIFITKPLVAIAVLLCLGTIIALFKLNRRRPQSRADQFLIGFIGLLTVFEAMKLLKQSGVVSLSLNDMLNDAIELLVAGSCFAAAIMLRASQVNRFDVESAVRLARAAPPRSAHLDIPVARDSSTLDTLSWASSRVSDGAFKLLAVLCMRSDGSGAQVPVGVTDMQLKLGKSKEELDVFLKELQDAGAVALRRDGGKLNIEIVSQAKKIAPAEPFARPAPTLATESQP